MYDFEWYERAVTKLKLELDEGRISQREFDDRMSELQHRKAQEPAMLERLTKAGILWA